MKVYHFCMMHQNPDNTLHYFDGTMKTDADLLIPEAYNALKDAIAKAAEPPREGKNIILLSLTVISA